MYTDFEWLFYTEDYRKEHVFKTFTATELYDIRNGRQSEKMSNNEWRSEREKHQISNDCLVFFLLIWLKCIMWQWLQLEELIVILKAEFSVDNGRLWMECLIPSLYDRPNDKWGFVNPVLYCTWFCSSVLMVIRIVLKTTTTVRSVMKKYVWFWLSIWILS
jgi:hypothetical protein